MKVKTKIILNEIKRTFLWYLYFVAAMVIYFGVAALLVDDFDNHSKAEPLLAYLVYIAVVIVPVLIAKRKNLKAFLSRAFSTKKINKASIRKASLIYLVVVALYTAFAFSATTEELMATRDNIVSDNVWFYGSIPIGYAVTFFTTSIVAPVLEEFTFREMVFHNRKSSRRFSAIASSIAFSLIHFNFGLAAITYVVLGLFFAKLTEENDSIVPSIVAHALWNTMILVLPIIFIAIRG